MAQTLTDMVNPLQAELNSIASGDVSKAEIGVKAAGTRVRVTLSNIAKLASAARKQVMEDRKKADTGAAKS